jgi:hypothetical protein
MDPNETLKIIRDLIEEILDPEAPATDTNGRDLAEDVQALDSWLSRGGYLPEAWQPSDDPPSRPATYNGLPTGT